MSKKITQHVVKTPDGTWAVKKGGAARATKVHKTQQAAIAHGRKIAKKQRAEFYVHGKDGTIKQKDSYGKDPIPPRDKR